MPFSGMTFNLFTDAGLTITFGGTLQVVNKTDLSDNPQDFLIYLGSSNASRILQATSNPGVDDIVLTPTLSLPQWAISTAYTVGQRVRGKASDTGFIYSCTVAGTSAATEPTWPVGGLGSTVVDGGVTWSKLSAEHEITEVKLASTSGGLDTATAGAALNLGDIINGGVGNASPIYIRITNAVTNVANNTGQPDLGLFINSVIETAVV